MISGFINQLVEEKLTTIPELEEVTGRSASTIYRWINRESTPDCQDIHKILRYIKNPAATRKLLSLMTADLPVIIEWLEEQKQQAITTVPQRRAANRETVAVTILALECVADLLHQEHNALENDEVSDKEYTKLVGLIDDAMSYLMKSKQQLGNLLTRRKKIVLRVS